MFFKNLDYAAGWLAGIIDGEGWVQFPHNGKNDRYVMITNTDVAIIQAVEQALLALEIDYSVANFQPKNPKYRRCYNVTIRNQYALCRLYRLINLAAPDKQEKFTLDVASYKNWLDKKPFDAKQAVDLYSAGLSMDEIAAFFKISRDRVRGVIHKAGKAISQSEKVRKAWKKNPKRIPVSDETLIDMYLNERLLAAEIGAKLGINAASILWRLRKLGIKLSEEEYKKRLHRRAKESLTPLSRIRRSAGTKKWWATVDREVMSQKIKEGWAKNDEAKKRISDLKTQWHKDNKEKFKESLRKAWVKRRLKLAAKN